MNNKIAILSTKRQGLLTAIIVVGIYVAVFLVALFCIAQIGKTNLDGQTANITGTVKFTQVDDDTSEIVITTAQNIESQYNVNPLLSYLNHAKKIEDTDEAEANFVNSLIGKTVTISVPMHPYDSDNVWILGLIVDGQTIAETQDVLEYKIQDNNVTLIVMAALAAACAIALCVLIVVRHKLPKTSDSPLDKMYASFMSQYHPTANAKAFSIATIVCALATIAYTIVCGILTESVLEQQSDVLFIILAIAFVVEIVAFVIGMVRLARRNVDLYVSKFPFDFAELEASNLPQKTKQELREQMLAVRQANPNVHSDGGNNYFVKFTQDGVELYFAEIDEYDRDDEEQFQNTNPNNVAKSLTEGKQPTFTLTYQQCNFKAVPFFNGWAKPLVVIVESRLTRTDDMPQDFTNDIHIVLDKPLLDTLTQFNVQVENLDDILTNKKLLLTDKKARQKYKQNNK